MGKNKIFAVDVLDKKSLEMAVTLSADKVVSNERICDTSGFPHIEFINSEVYRIPGTFESYAYNSAIIDGLMDRHEGKFVINGINIRKAIPKMVYWTNYKTGYLHACIKASFDPADIVYVTPYLAKNKIRETIKYLRLFTSNNVKYLLKGKRSHREVTADKKIGLLVNDEFELGVFEYLIKAIPAKDLLIFNYGNINFGKYAFISDEVGKVNLSKIMEYSPQPFINPVSLSAEELSIVNIVCRDWQRISLEIGRYKYIRETSIKAIVINVGENLPVKNLMTGIFNGRIKVYNTMNGMKSGEAHDGDVYFDKWFVWDEQMKRMLVEKCGLDPGMLAVTGHLMKDFVRDYTYRNTLGIPAEKLAGKKVISVFSVRGSREEKQETFKYLYELLERDDSYFLLVRPHPLEKENEIIHPSPAVTNIHFVRYNWQNSKQTLYDQIYLSNIGIVFGSTVAMECEWMNVPAVTFEKKKMSNIYNIDGARIHHVQSIQELGHLIEGMQKKTMTDRIPNNDINVAGKIMEVINHD